MPPRQRRWALSRAGGLTEALRLVPYVLFAAAVPLLMRLRLPLLARLLQHSTGATVRPGVADTEPIVRNVTRALRYGQPLVRRGCLTRGLTLYYFLRRAGVNVRLCFGARHRAGAFEAHCWLERAGQPFLEETDDWGCRFERVCTLPLEGADGA
jgi:hypothetical protein